MQNKNHVVELVQRSSHVFRLKINAFCKPWKNTKSCTMVVAHTVITVRVRFPW